MSVLSVPFCLTTDVLDGDAFVTENAIPFAIPFSRMFDLAGFETTHSLMMAQDPDIEVNYNIQLGIEVCTQAYASLYIAIQVGIPSCHHIMSQHVLGDDTMKLNQLYSPTVSGV